MGQFFKIAAELYIPASRLTYDISGVLLIRAHAYGVTFDRVECTRVSLCRVLWILVLNYAGVKCPFCALCPLGAQLQLVSFIVWQEKV